MEKETALSKYIIGFSVAYVLLLIIFSIALRFFNIPAEAGLEIGAIIGAIYITISNFVANTQRIPYKTEKRKLIWLSFIWIWCISLLEVLIQGLSYEGSLTVIFDDLSYYFSLDNLIAIGIGFAIISIIDLIVIYFSYSGFAKLVLKTMQKKENIEHQT